MAKRSSATLPVGVMSALLAVTAMAGPVSAGVSGDVAPSSEVKVANSEVADLVEAMNIEQLVESHDQRKLPSAESRTPLPEPDQNLQAPNEAERLAEVRSDLKASGIGIVEVTTEVVGVEHQEYGKTVTVDVHRTMDDGQVWEEFENFFILDADMKGVKAGTVLKVSFDSAENDLLIEGLNNDVSGPATDMPGEVTPSSTPSNASDIQPPSTSERKANSATERQPRSLKRANSANSGKVMKYALKYAKVPNKNYYTYSNDCTGFVSQALRAGGWKYKKGWYRSSKNWWYSGVPGLRASWTWAGAENWFKFARGSSKRATALSSVYSVKGGDILQYKVKGRKNMTHTMVVTGYSKGVPLLSYHTNNTRNKPFTSIKDRSSKYWYASAV